VNDEVERFWNEDVNYKVLSQHLPGGTEKIHEKLQNRIVGLLTVISIREFPNMKQ
jgi:hypothetical protein